MKGKITSSQFFMLFFLSSTYYVSTISGYELKDNFTDSIISAFISAVLGWLLALPILTMQEKSKLNQAHPAIGVFYIAYFILSDIYVLAAMQTLMTSTILPDLPPILIGIMAVVVAIYGATKGIEAVARAGLLIFVIMVIGIVTIYIGLIPLWNNSNRVIMMYGGISDSLTNTFEIFARSSFLPQAAILLTAVKGKLKVKSLCWNLAGALLASSAFVYIVFCLGGFASTQLFPVYMLSSISELIPIQRLDIIYSVVWLTSLTIRLSCDFLAIKACLGKKVKSGAIPLVIIGGIILLISLLFTDSSVMSAAMKWVPYMGIPAIILGTVIPIITRRQVEK